MKKSALLGIWGDSDISRSYDEEEDANLYLMAIEDEVNYEKSSNFTLMNYLISSIN